MPKDLPGNPEDVKAPPPFHMIGQHEALVRPDHDAQSHYNFMASYMRHVFRAIGPNNKVVYEGDVEAKLEKDLGRKPEHRREVMKGMLENTHFQLYSALRRNAFEMRQQIARYFVFRDIDDVNQRIANINGADPDGLILNSDVKPPRYVSAIDHHCFPGSYYTSYVPNDASAGAIYDFGLYQTTAGALGPYSEGAGAALADWLKKDFPDFKPKRILDIGCTVGHSLLPIAEAFPDAEVVALDVAAPMLRYAHARARSLGVDNITFMQMNGEETTFEDESFDLVFTSIFVHETSTKALQNLFNEAHRLLKPGGLTFHLDLPPYTDEMPLFEQAMRDWDAYYNNEPFWTTLHDLDVLDMHLKAGFSKDQLVETQVDPLVENPVSAGGAPMSKAVIGSNAKTWYVFGAWKD